MKAKHVYTAENEDEATTILYGAYGPNLEKTLEGLVSVEDDGTYRLQHPFLKDTCLRIDPDLLPEKENQIILNAAIVV